MYNEPFRQQHETRQIEIENSFTKEIRLEIDQVNIHMAIDYCQGVDSIYCVLYRDKITERSELRIDY
mgnify:CR=1 FL=1